MTLKLENHDTEEELEKEIKSSKNCRYQLRLRAILMLKQGIKPGLIKKALIISDPTYSEWIRKYNNSGKEALKKYGSGRKEGNPVWDQSIFDELFKNLDCMEEYWSVIKMQKWIKDSYDVSIPCSTIDYKLHKANYSWKTSRPSPYKGDAVKQEDFKKMELKRWLRN